MLLQLVHAQGNLEDIMAELGATLSLESLALSDNLRIQGMFTPASTIEACAFFQVGFEGLAVEYLSRCVRRCA